jgi:hypothetical protein
MGEKTMKSALALLILVCSLSSFAEEVVRTEAGPTENDKGQYCQAHTYCYNGQVITCEAWGQGCSWYVQPGQYVTCTGFDRFGYWGNFYAYCY